MRVENLEDFNLKLVLNCAKRITKTGGNSLSMQTIALKKKTTYQYTLYLCWNIQKQYLKK